MGRLPTTDPRTGSPPPWGDTQAVVPVKIGAATQSIRLEEIRHITACENYTAVQLTDRQRLFVRRTMQQWTSVLPSAQFARVHRGLLVNLQRIGRIDRGPEHSVRLYLAGDALPPLEVNRRHWPTLREKLERWRGTVAGSLIAAGGKSVGVLPFLNLTQDPANEVFCEGTSEELLNVLAKIPGLRVAARTSSFYFKHRNVPVAEIGQRLGVDYIVEGSVRQAGRRIRVTAQLISAATGFHLWSDNFDRESTDILALQDEIAGLVAEKLQLKIGGAARPRATVNSQAHRLTLEGRHFWGLRTQHGFLRAEKAFLEAIAVDPGLAAAYAGLADVCVVRAMYRLADGNGPASDDLERATAAATRALELDPALAEPHATLGFACFHAGRFGEAIRHYPKAFAANPNYATGHQFHAWTLAAMGHLHRALRVYETAVTLDPLSFINIDRHAAMLMLAGRITDALKANERAAALRPDLFVGNVSQRAPILLALSRVDEAVAAARAVRNAEPDALFRRNSDADAIFVLHRVGLREEADAYANEVLARLLPQNHLRGFVYAATGRHNQAWPSLRYTPSIMLPFLYWSPVWDAVRENRAFLDLIDALGRTEEYRLARTP
jgi:TolB-like protein/Tfp pilus assembly protein PilF